MILFLVGESKTDDNSLTCMESDTLWINPKVGKKQIVFSKGQNFWFRKRLTVNLY